MNMRAKRAIARFYKTVVLEILRICAKRDSRYGHKLRSTQLLPTKEPITGFHQDLKRSGRRN